MTVSPLSSLIGCVPSATARQRGAWLALPAGGDDQDLVLGQPHRRFGIDGVGEIGEIARRLRDLQDPVQRAPGDAQLAPRLARDLAQRVQATGVRGEGRDQHAPLGLGHRLGEAAANARLRTRRLGVEHVGRIAHEHVDALVADRGQRLRRRRRADHRCRVDLPVAGVEHLARRRFDQQRAGLGDRVRQFDEGNAEWPDLEGLGVLDDLQLYAVADALFVQLAADQARGELGRVERHAEVLGEIRQRADMILMPVCQHDADEVVEAFLDEGEVGQDHVDTGVSGVGEGDAAIHHQPLAVAAIEIDVHADLSRAAKGAEEQFVVSGCHSDLSGKMSVRPSARIGASAYGQLIWAFSAMMASPCIVRSASTWSKTSVCRSNSVARPPVAITFTGRPTSSFIRATNPSIIAI